LSERRMIGCNGCGLEVSYDPEHPAWRKWARFQRPNWAAPMDVIDLCPDCVTRLVKEFPLLRERGVL
jgi:hypothetical protein